MTRERPGRAGDPLRLGFGNVHGVTCAQARIAPDIMGRVMSVVIMGSIGLVPVSMVIAGVLLSPAVGHMGFEPPAGIPA